MINRYTVPIVTDAAGAATVYLGRRITGPVKTIKYEPGDIATGADLVVTGETTAMPVLTKANAGTSTVFYHPRAVSNQVADGAASAITEVEVHLCQEQLKVVVAQGGDTKTGAITVWADEPVF